MREYHRLTRVQPRTYLRETWRQKKPPNTWLLLPPPAPPAFPEALFKRRKPLRVPPSRRGVRRSYVALFQQPFPDPLLKQKRRAVTRRAIVPAKPLRRVQPLLVPPPTPAFFFSDVFRRRAPPQPVQRPGVRRFPAALFPLPATPEFPVQLLYRRKVRRQVTYRLKAYVPVGQISPAVIFPDALFKRRRRPPASKPRAPRRIRASIVLLPPPAPPPPFPDPLFKFRKPRRLAWPKPTPYHPSPALFPPPPTPPVFPDPLFKRRVFLRLSWPRPKFRRPSPLYIPAPVPPPPFPAELARRKKRKPTPPRWRRPRRDWRVLFVPEAQPVFAAVIRREAKIPFKRGKRLRRHPATLFPPPPPPPVFPDPLFKFRKPRRLRWPRPEFKRPSPLLIPPPAPPPPFPEALLRKRRILRVLPPARRRPSPSVLLFGIVGKETVIAFDLEFVRDVEFDLEF